ncbi:MAG: aspartate--tRNA ligase [Thermoanaerobaculia bacterium]|nr:aspartate--tRNA ligase [Thermoanaerobaculia bacterium]
MTKKSRVPAGSLGKSDANSRVCLRGWVNRRRDHGDLVFIDLRDRSGITQVVFDAQFLPSPELLERAKELRSEFVLEVEGEVILREKEAINPDLKTGEIEVRATGLEILNRAETPPFPIEDEVRASEDLRLKYRYLDLRRPEMTRNFILRSDVTYRVRQLLHAEGFLEVETPILTKSTPEGARDFLVPSRIHRGKFYALPQSPQLFKQLLMVSGLERYYQIARCFRDEDLRADRQPEFTQIDLELSFPDEEDVYELIEKLFVAVFPPNGIPCEAPFRRMKYAEAMERYGIDRPDTRFGLELSTLDASASPSEILKKAQIVKGFAVPGGAGFARKRLDDLEFQAKNLGAGGLIWIKLDASLPGGWNSNAKKVLNEETIAAFRGKLQAADGSLLLVVAGKEKSVNDTLSTLRAQIGREEKLIPEGRYDFLWVTDFPLLEWHEDDARWYATHHPFTSPKPEDLDYLESDPGRVRARAYDVVLNGMELGGGSIRIHRQDVQSRIFSRLGIGPEEAREKFGFLLDAFRYGAPPHGGLALGLDRMLMILAKAGSIRDVIAFPKTASGTCLMTESPGPVASDQLTELGIQIRPPQAGS